MDSLHRRVSTGIPGFDNIIDSLRLGDNVVWQVDSVEDYAVFAVPFAEQAIRDHRRVIYMRFGNHPPILPVSDQIQVFSLDPNNGFESFATQVYHIISQEGKFAFYVFDCLTDLLEQWCSDLMLGNFFKITCPHLFSLDTVAYFSIIRNRHSFDSIARIRDTTQLLLDLKNIAPYLYLHPLKVWERYSSTMFLPHKYVQGAFDPVTSSVDSAGLFHPKLSEQRTGGQIDYWDKLFLEAEGLLSLPVGSPERKAMFSRLIHVLIGKDPTISGLAHRFLTLEDIIKIKNRQIGTGYIGGKSVGMLLARNILIQDEEFDFSSCFEAHDSFYLGSDIFYTYLVQNGWWNLRMRQITPEGYFTEAAVMKEKFLSGTFPALIRDRFMEMLEYFGQSPIIVRSSSLLEDNFGNAFAGKYESIFCVNQGSPEERYQEFENAVRQVYASTMNENALNYRLKRGLAGKDEQMALLVQRVSGDYHNQYFFPTLAGVGNSYNLYVWDKQIDPEAGMLRLVFGLGTRAVDRVSGDYPRVVSLDKPLLWPVEPDKRARYSQHDADVLDLQRNVLCSVPVSDLLAENPDIDRTLLGEHDYSAAQRMRELGISRPAPFILSFQRLLSASAFPEYLKQLLACLEKNYSYPVDIEYTVNFTKDGAFHLNLLQCRPLQTKGLGKTVEFPSVDLNAKTLFYVKGDFMGGNTRIPIRYLIHVDPKGYSLLTESRKYEVARIIGTLNRRFDRDMESALLMTPGRLGTTTPSLGVPVTFSEISNMSVVCEVEFESAGLMPELSYGSHFFQDLVESDIFYVALFLKKQGNYLNETWITDRPSSLAGYIENPSPELENVIKIIDFSKTASDTPSTEPEKMTPELYSDVITQQCIFKW